MEAVNLNAPRPVDGWRQKLLDALLPPRCLLCGDSGATGRDLCSGCRADFSRNGCCCPRCALPLQTPAPLCGACLRREPPFAAAWAPFLYSHPLDLLEARFKFGRDLAAGRVLAQLMLQQAHSDTTLQLPQLLLCVPLHPQRLRERGYNQALELARPLAHGLQIPMDAHALQRQRPTRAQTGLDAKARRRNLRDAFRLRDEHALPGHVAIVDDVMTTGSTLRECARVLRRGGVERVDVWALARAANRR